MIIKEKVRNIIDKVHSLRRENVEFLRRTMMVYVVIFVLWGIYRLLLPFPVFVEELFFKPIVFLLPILIMLKYEGRRGKAFFRALGFNRSELFLSIYFGLTLGIVYVLGVILSGMIFSKIISLRVILSAPQHFLGIFLLASVTALWEQTTFSGFFLLRFQRSFRDDWRSVIVVGLLFSLVHFPVIWLETHILLYIIVQLLLLFLVGFGNAVLMLRVRNVFAPILAHTLWVFTLGLLG